MLNIRSAFWFFLLLFSSQSFAIGNFFPYSITDHHRIVLLGRSTDTKQCLTASYSKANWTNLHFEPCSFAYNPRQEFLFEAQGEAGVWVRSLHSNKCLYNAPNDPNNRALQLYTCGAWWRVDGQMFQLQPGFNSPNGLLLVTEKTDGDMLTVTVSTSLNNRAVVDDIIDIRANPTASLTQRIIFERSPQASRLRNYTFDESKAYSISPRASGLLCLGVSNVQSESTVSQQACSMINKNQRFGFESLAGYYRIRVLNSSSMEASSYCLDFDVDADSPALIQAICSAKDSQLFAIEEVRDFTDPVQAFFIIPVMQTQVNLLVPDVSTEADLSMNSESFLVLLAPRISQSDNDFNYLKQHFLIQESP